MTSTDILDPEIAAFAADQDRTFDAAFGTLPIGEQRARYEAFCQRYHAPRPEGLTVEDRSIRLPGRDLSIRIYRPVDLPKPYPVIMYCHGGSWMLGGLDSHDMATARLAMLANAAVVAIDYRLAPEHRFPAALIDAWEALHWIIGRGVRVALDPERVVVAGDSAGAVLSAGVALLARDRGGPRLRAQGLIYPALRPPQGRDDKLLSDALAAYLAKTEDARNPYAMPLLATDLTHLPPAVICAAGLDVLLPDALDYAAALKAAGVEVRLLRGKGLPHTFLRALHLSAVAADTFQAFGRELSALLRA